MATDWSDAAKAKRSAAAKKAAETRKANQAKKLATIPPAPKYQIPNSRVARWALSGVAVGAMMRRATHVRWFRRTPLQGLPFEAAI